MSDELDSLSDKELSDVFAVEVAGWLYESESRWPWSYPDGSAAIYDPVFATDANAVLPLVTIDVTMCTFVHKTGRWHMRDCFGHPHSTAKAGTFARCACILCIRVERAKRAAK